MSTASRMPPSGPLQPRQRITGVVLAGGEGRRMGRLDKGLQPLRGKPLARWVIERFAPQVDELLVNANRHLDEYARFGFPVVRDAIDGSVGPLAGLHRALGAAQHALVATAPCDSPFLPSDLIGRLLAGLEEKGADLALARTGTRTHPVFCLCRKEVQESLTVYLQNGGRKIDSWYASLRVVEVAFDDELDAFTNINTPEELAAFEREGECLGARI